MGGGWRPSSQLRDGKAPSKRERRLTPQDGPPRPPCPPSTTPNRPRPHLTRYQARRRKRLETLRRPVIKVWDVLPRRGGSRPCHCSSKAGGGGGVHFLQRCVGGRRTSGLPSASLGRCNPNFRHHSTPWKARKGVHSDRAGTGYTPKQGASFCPQEGTRPTWDSQGSICRPFTKKCSTVLLAMFRQKLDRSG